MNERDVETPPSGQRWRDESFLTGAGEMAALVRSIYWADSPLGPLDKWPQSLRTTMSICLSSRFPIAVYWGPEYLMLYNQSLVPMVVANKHPQAFGQSARVVLAEIWSIIEPSLRHVRTTGEATWSEDLMLPLARTGAPEESYFTFSFSPVRDGSEGVGGVFCAVIETTEKVIEGRRLRLLNELAEAALAATPAEACEQAAEKLAGATADIPFAALYLLDGKGSALLAATANLDSGSALAPLILRPGAEAAPWPFEDLDDDPLPVAGAGQFEGTRGAMLLPLQKSADGRRLGFIVVGLSALLGPSASYTRFHTLLAASVSQAVSSAVAYEEERRRAEALAELDRAKAAFFSNVSHEFRTPLTLLLGPAEDALAAADTLSAQERERWALVQRSALRISKLVNTLLDFSRIEAGRIEACFEATDLCALTGELASMFRSAIERSGLALRLELEQGEPAYVDHDMWEKIVLNLLSNALKFTFEGEISVALRMLDDDFELVVRDTGIGMAPDELPLVFDRFHRVRGARARTREGTGIGLALVAELVKLHGGTVRVESVEKQGTAIQVRLPRGLAHLPSDRLGTARSLPSTSNGVKPFVEEALRWTDYGTVRPSNRVEALPPAIPGAPRARIVLADDNADMREYLSRLLRERWDVEACTDGRQALAAVKEKRTDLVLSDVMMPGLDGFGLLQEIRTDPSLCVTPVVLLSARAGADASIEGLAAGANDYIVKPFSARELLVRVASNLALARAAEQAHALAEAERRRLYGHFMQAPFPIAVLRGERHVVELANPTILQAWGKDEAILGKPIAEGIPELYGQPLVGYLDAVLRDGVAYQARGALVRLARTPDHPLDEHYFDFVYAPLVDDAGAVEGILVAAFEVTAQVRASHELSSLLAAAEQGERQFRELVDNQPELAWTARRDGFIDYYNQRWFDYTGTTLEQMQGWGWQAVHDPEKIEAVTERWQHCIRTGEPFEMEFPLRGADGVFRWFLTRVKPLHDADGNIVRWFGSNTNIDERRKNDDFRETFVGILGHDLRNPLNTILTTSRVLTMREDTPPEIKKRLDRVTASGVRIQRMIDQLLDLTRARLADGIPLELSAAPLDVGTIVAKIIDEIAVANPSVAIELHREGDCTVSVDPDRIEQVVSNLVANAVTHGDTTQPIRVSLNGQSSAVKLAVHNHGAPIDPAFLPLLFNPFARSERPGGHSQGLGLGLYISERIIDAHGGRLSAQSSAALGTCFEAVLPRNRQ